MKSNRVNEILSTCLALLKQADEKEHYVFQTDLISPNRMALLLKERAVPMVILNACRSARDRSPESSIVANFLEAGVSIVVAMNYMITSLSVAIFTACVYRALLERGLSLHAAVQSARKTMQRSPERLSKFGTSVHLDDFLVPLIFGKSRFIYNDTNPVGLVAVDVADLDLEDRCPYGQEDDIMHVESALLRGKRPLLLSGIAGVGKTALVKHLWRSWKGTGLIREYIYIPLDITEGFDMTLVRRKVQRHFLCLDVEYDVDSATLVELLRNNRYLLIIDSWESAAVSDPSSTRNELRSFLQDIRGGETLVIIVSRDDETWLAGETITYTLNGLGILSGLQWIRGIIDAAQTILSIASWDSEEDTQYFEQIIKLVNGHPLALKTPSERFSMQT